MSQVLNNDVSLRNKVKSMTIYFELRKDHKDKLGMCPLSLNYTYNGFRLRLNTEVSIPENYYRKELRHISQKVIDPSIKEKDIDFNELTQKLENCETKLKSIIEGWKKLDKVERGIGEYPDKDYVSDYYYNKQVKGIEKPMIVHLIEHIYGRWDPIIKEYVGGKKGDLKIWNSILGDVLEVRGHKIDFRKYKTEKVNDWRKVIEDILLKKDNNLNKFFLKDVNKGFLDTYCEVLLKRKYGKRIGLENTTIKKRLKTFKEFLNQMIKEHHKVNDDFRTFVLQKETYEELELDTNIHLLTFEEYEYLLHFDLSHNPRLDYVRDLYLICCGTGLRFSDVVRIQPQMIKKKKIDGKTIKYIEIRTQKTKKPVSPPITEKIEKILKKYDFDMKRSFRGGLHTISNDKGNEYLKEVLDLIKLDSLNEPDENLRRSGKNITSITGERKDFITFHSGRRFFITNCLVSGIPINLIIGWTGHIEDWDVLKRYIDKKYGISQYWDKIPF